MFLREKSADSLIKEPLRRCQVPAQYFSSYFAVPKSKRIPDKWRPILNLKKFNKYACQVYFKIADVRAVRKWFQHGTMCVELDLKDAFLHVPMAARIK